MIFFVALLLLGLYANTSNGQLQTTNFITTIEEYYKNIPYLLYSQESKDEALKNAISKKNSAKVSALLTYGANPCRQCINGTTYLMLAAATGDTMIYNLLKEVAYEKNICDDFGRNLLIYAARGGCLAIIKDCYEQENQNAKTYQDWTPLLTAAYHGCHEAVLFFIEQGASLSDITKQSETAFMLAIKGNNPIAISLLCKFGASQSIDDKRTTPLMYAADQEVCESLRWLLQEGHDPSVKNDEGRTVLMYCANNNLDEPIPDLLLYGNPQLLLKQRSNKNNTALDVARKYERYKVQDILNDYNSMTSLIEQRRKEIIKEKCTLKILQREPLSKASSKNVMNFLRLREINGK